MPSHPLALTDPPCLAPTVRPKIGPPSLVLESPLSRSVSTSPALATLSLTASLSPHHSSSLLFADSLTTFDLQGNLTQVDYAQVAVANGSTSLGIKASNGVVIATKKPAPSPLVDDSDSDKIAIASKSIGMTYSGIGPDFRVMADKGRKEVQRYFLEYKDDIPVSQFVRSLAGVAQEYTQSGGVRPFGVALLVAGYDEQGPQLYQVDPSGSYWAWKASAIGANSKNARNFLEKRYDPTMEIEDAVHTAILTLREDFEGAMTESNIEVGVIRSDRVFKKLSAAEISAYLADAS